MVEPSIRYAIDPDTGGLVDVKDPLPRKWYRCTSCGGQLKREQGIQQIWHFRHRGDAEAKTCDRYYGGAYNELVREEIQKSDIEKAEKKKQIRLVVQTKAYGRTLAFYGVLPVLTFDEIPLGRDLPTVLSSLTFSHQGVLGNPSQHLFDPSEPEALIDLDPSAGNFALQIESPEPGLELVGLWKAEALREGDVFVGTATRAERKDVSKGPDEGDTVFVLLSTVPASPPDGAEVFRLGRWHVVSFELSADSARYLEELTGVQTRTAHPFHVDIVLPAYADPSSQAPILGKPGDELLFAISPVGDLDPSFEVVPIPLGKGDAVPVPPTGVGRPRWFTSLFPGEGSLGLSVHWVDRHRAVLLHADGRAEASRLRSSLGVEKGIEIAAGREGRHYLSPLDFPSTTIERIPGASHLEDFGIVISVPEGMQFDVVALLTKGSVRGTYDVPKLESEFRAWVREGLSKMVLDFGPLGWADIRFESTMTSPTKVKVTLSNDEIKAILVAMNPLPRKARWPLVRAVCGASSGTLHALPGMKKRIRRMLMEVRESGRDH